MKIQLSIAVALFLIAGTAAAQNANTITSNNQNSSTSRSNTSSGSASYNRGVTAVVNQTSSGQIHYSGSYDTDISSQVPLSVMGYGSFSQNSCQNSVGGGATTKVFSFVYNGSHTDVNCEHMVRSISFGQESQLAASRGLKRQAELLRSAGVWETCTANEQTKKMCLRMGLINPTQDTDEDGDVVAGTMPAPNLKPWTAHPSIPIRPKGWTNAKHVAAYNAKQARLSVQKRQPNPSKSITANRPHVTQVGANH